MQYFGNICYIMALVITSRFMPVITVCNHKDQIVVCILWYIGNFKAKTYAVDCYKLSPYKTPPRILYKSSF